MQPKILFAVEPTPQTEQLNSPNDASLLTDGKYATNANIYDTAFFKFCRGIERRLVFDLGADREIAGFKASFLYDTQTAVNLPRVLKVLLSENGTDWQAVHKQFGLFADEEPSIVAAEAKFDSVYKARFAAFEFNVDCWVFCDEIELYGSETISENAKTIVPDPIVYVDYPNKYIYPEDFHNVHDIMLFYNCLAKNPPVGLVPKEKILPYVGYINKDGKIADTFFDSYLFLPFVSNAPSGGFYYDNPKAPGNFSDWKYYVDNVFEDGYNINALNDAAGEVKAATGRHDYIVNVFFSVLFPVRTQTQFGSPVEGESFDFTNVADRKTAIKWLIDEQMVRIDKGDYKHLKLLGFYWFHESINFGDKQELELIKYTTDYVRSLGLNTIWIPYYQASGYNSWAELGFDVACMQPNYAFSKNPPKIVYDCAEAVKKLGMCLEMEIGGLTQEHVDKYNIYLKAGVETGYMDALHMYYQGGGPGEFYKALNSNDPYVNAVYHDTYKFVKHTLK
ncbi:MAG: hypothetical protein A2Y17_10830 [Clostridiales bacterium GWF2_38_85]|nr:MAG: hypothetical protein A2Y17_10830 [Clostridiales bacterium GWF2_38_85]